MSQPKQQRHEPDLMLVIPCLNEDRHLTDLLHDIKDQTSQPTHVVVVDCDSIDNTVAIAKGFASVLPLRLGGHRTQRRRRGTQLQTQ